MATSPGNILLTTGTNQAYPSLGITPSSSATVSQTVSLNSTLPTGFTLSFDSNPVKVNPGFTRSVQLSITVAQSVSPGDYKITVGAQSGSTSKTIDFTVHVVQYLVLMQSNAFSPDSVTVKQGSTVYWINLDAPGGGDPEVHNVVFTSGTNTVSPTLSQYGTFSYTFTTAGTYSYYCTFHPTAMNGKITVTA